MNDFRLLSTLSPEIEIEMYSNINNVVISETLKQIMLFFSKIKNGSVFVIPVGLKGIMSADPMLRLLKDRIIFDTQCNVIFDNGFNFDECVNDNISGLFKDFEYGVITTKYILSYMQKFRLPVLFGTKQHSIEKIKCNDCDPQVGCNPNIVLTGHSPPDLGKFLEIIKTTVGVAITHWHCRRNTLTEIDVKILMVMMCLFHQVEDKDLAVIKNISIPEPFLRDIRHNNIEISRIIFSLFRACAYESSTSRQGHHQLSTDWHPNSPSKCGRFELFRADVLDLNRSGIKLSGAERILIGKSNGINTAICYTNKHDFPKKTIETRITEIG